MADLINPSSCLRVPGRLVDTPTAGGLTGAFPHGGTSLGLVASAIFRLGEEHQTVRAEEFGGEVAEVIKSGTSPLFACVLRGFTDAIVDRLFPETAVGSSSGDRLIRRTSATRAGRLGSGDAFPLLFAPREPAVHPGLIIYNAVPIFENVAEIPLNTEAEVGVAVVFRALRDGTGRLYEFAKLEDMAV